MTVDVLHHHDGVIHENADREALEDGLKSIINLHYQGRLRAIQVHFSPAQLGDELTNEQLLLNFPELLPL